MKKFISLMLLLALIQYSFSQHTGMAQTKPMTDYLRKSKTQKTFAWILTGIGVTVITAGLLSQDYVNAFTLLAQEKNTTSTAVYVAGGACIAGGIVLFIAASKNKKKAGEINAFLKMEKISQPQVSIISEMPYPALGIRLRLQ